MTHIQEFLTLIESNQFKNAHEALEVIWKEYKQTGNKNEELLLKGLINGATALELIRLGRIEASAKAWSVLLKYSYHLEFIPTQKRKVYTHAIAQLTHKKETL